MRDLNSLLNSADDLRVDALAQDPWCADPDQLTVRETFAIAGERGYDILPVRREDGAIRTTVATKLLAYADSWDAVLPHQESLTPDRLVARESPVLRLLDRLHEHAILFTLGRSGVDGVVTVYDLNQPAAHLFAFGMALICEADVAETLRRVLGEDPDHAFAVAAETLSASPGLRRWKRMRRTDDELHIASTLMFGEKLTLLRATGLEKLAQLHGLPPDAIARDLEGICALRNAVGHYDDQLDDPEWVFDRMRLAQSFAERVIARGPS
jgi:hypothetical protein